MDAFGAAQLLTGGSSARSSALVGPPADQTVRTLGVDLLILGTHGVCERALTSPNLAEAAAHRALVAAARRVVVVADHTKWAVTALSSFAAFTDIDAFVTGSDLSGQARAVLAESVGELVVAALRGG